jgi:hypothetical protein
MRLSVGLLLLGWGLAGCVSGPQPTNATSVSVADQGYGFNPDGRVWVRGPWTAIQPSRDMDEVIDQLCPAVMELPLATFGDYGREYCGAVYTLGEGTYYASKPSPLRKNDGKEPASDKTCITPRTVIDQRGHAVTQLDYHGHPWRTSPMSDKDRQETRQIWPIRIQFDGRCTIQKFVPNLDNSRPGEVYERRGKAWVLIGLVKPEDKPSGHVTPITNP